MSTVVPLRGIGLKGLQRNAARESLPLDRVWELRNVRALKGKLETSPGTTDLGAGVMTGRPLKITGWLQDNGDFRINVHTDKRIYRVDEFTGALTDITRVSGGDYTGSRNQLVDTVAAFNHILSVNGLDNPQKWDGVAANASDIGGTPVRAGTITSALTYAMLGALVTNKRGIAWSDSSNFENWTTGDAGSLTLYQGPGEVLRLLPIGEIVVAYRENSIHILFFVGAPFIWGQRQIVSDFGLIAPRAVVDIGGKHVYWGTDNVYLFDGAKRVSIADDVIDEMKASFDPSLRNNISASVDFTDREVYFAYPKVGDAGVNKQAWVWSWANGSWRQEDLEATAAGNWRRRQSQTWDSVSGTWDGIGIGWDEITFLDKIPVMVVGTDGGKLSFLDTSSVNNLGVARSRVVETGLFNPGELIFQSPNSKATLERIEIEQENKGTHNLEVSVATQDTLTGDTVLTYTAFTIIADGTKRIITPRKTGRYFAIRFRTQGLSEPFRLSGIYAYFVKRGDR